MKALFNERIFCEPLKKNPSTQSFGKRSGFSLVEIITTIAIISIISIVGFTYANNYRLSQFNTRRVADISTLQSAIKSYYATKGDYPKPAGNKQYFDINGTYAHSQSGAYGVSGFVTSEVFGKEFLATTPMDPQSGNFYAYAKTLTYPSFDFATANDVNGTYFAYLKGDFSGDDMASIIKEYSGPNFVLDKSSKYLPYNPYEIKLTGMISAYTGTVIITNSEGVAKSNTGDILEGDNVKVSAGGLATIHFSDGSEMKLGAEDKDSEINLSALSYKKEDNLVTKVMVKLSLGEIWVKAPELEDGSELMVEAGNAAASVRGTVFGMTYDNVSNTGSVNLAVGKIELQKVDDSGEVSDFGDDHLFETTGNFINDGGKIYISVPEGSLSGATLDFRSYSNSGPTGTSTGVIDSSEMNDVFSSQISFNSSYIPNINIRSTSTGVVFNYDNILGAKNLLLHLNDGSIRTLALNPGMQTLNLETSINIDDIRSYSVESDSTILGNRIESAENPISIVTDTENNDIDFVSNDSDLTLNDQLFYRTQITGILPVVNTTDIEQPDSDIKVQPILKEIELNTDTNQVSVGGSVSLKAVGRDFDGNEMNLPPLILRMVGDNTSTDVPGNNLSNGQTVVISDPGTYILYAYNGSLNSNSVTITVTSIPTSSCSGNPGDPQYELCSDSNLLAYAPYNNISNYNFVTQTSQIRQSTALNLGHGATRQFIPQNGYFSNLGGNSSDISGLYWPHSEPCSRGGLGGSCYSNYLDKDSAYGPTRIQQGSNFYSWQYGNGSAYTGILLDNIGPQDELLYNMSPILNGVDKFKIQISTRGGSLDRADNRIHILFSLGQYTLREFNSHLILSDTSGSIINLDCTGKITDKNSFSDVTVWFEGNDISLIACGQTGNYTTTTSALTYTLFVGSNSSSSFNQWNDIIDYVKFGKVADIQTKDIVVPKSNITSQTLYE